MKIATISSQRQITIPKAYLERLGMRKKDKIMLNIEGEKLVISPTKSVTDDVGGSLLEDIVLEKRGVSFEEVRKVTQILVAEEILDES